MLCKKLKHTEPKNQVNMQNYTLTKGDVGHDKPEQNGVPHLLFIHAPELHCVSAVQKAPI